MESKTCRIVMAAVAALAAASAEGATSVTRREATNLAEHVSAGVIAGTVTREFV